jgi:hypothetical protein
MSACPAKNSAFLPRVPTFASGEPACGRGKKRKEESKERTCAPRKQLCSTGKIAALSVVPKPFVQEFSAERAEG